MTIFNAMLSLDPTRTLRIRADFIRDLELRFNGLMKVITESVVDNDCLALSDKDYTIKLAAPGYARAYKPAGYKAYDFKLSTDKINGFMSWVNGEVKANVLEMSDDEQIGTAINSAWTNKYITSAYQKGLIRSRDEMKKVGMDIKTIAETPGGINAVFQKPFHIDSVGMGYSRTFRGLKGITDDMDRRMSEVLAQGIAEGRGPMQIASYLNKATNIGLNRARTLSQTEISRAHHSAMVNEYRNAGVIGVKIEVEILTAGDDRVCDQCKRFAETRGGKVRAYTLKEIETLIPIHPNCRCTIIPIVDTGIIGNRAWPIRKAA